MDEVVLARHGESETAAEGTVGGDAPLTATRGAIAGVPYGASLRLTRTELADVVERLDAWCEAPSR